MSIYRWLDSYIRGKTVDLVTEYKFFGSQTQCVMIGRRIVFKQEIVYSSDRMIYT